MTRPVQIKVFFGLMLVTKPVYLLMQLTIQASIIVVTFGYYFIYTEDSWLGRIILNEGPWFYHLLPWVLSFTFVLTMAQFVRDLRQFRAREKLFEGGEPKTEELR